MATPRANKRGTFAVYVAYTVSRYFERQLVAKGCFESRSTVRITIYPNSSEADRIGGIDKAMIW